MAERVMDELGRVRHGESSAGLGARVATTDCRVGVVVALLSADASAGSSTLRLRIVWLPPGRVSKRAAAATARAYRAGLREYEDLPAAGLVAVEAWLHPDRSWCVLDDPYHFGFCRTGGGPR